MIGSASSKWFVLGPWTWTGSNRTEAGQWEIQRRESWRWRFQEGNHPGRNRRVGGCGEDTARHRILPPEFPPPLLTCHLASGRELWSYRSRLSATSCWRGHWRHGQAEQRDQSGNQSSSVPREVTSSNTPLMTSPWCLMTIIIIIWNKLLWWRHVLWISCHVLMFFFSRVTHGM